MSAQSEYLAWISNSQTPLRIDNAAFGCNVYKVEEHINDVLTPVLSIGQLNIADYTHESPPFLEFLDFLKFVEEHNPRKALFLIEVPMHLFLLVEETWNYITASAVMDGKNSKITIWKYTS